MNDEKHFRCLHKSGFLFLSENIFNLVFTSTENSLTFESSEGLFMCGGYHKKEFCLKKFHMISIYFDNE